MGEKYISPSDEVPFLNRQEELDVVRRAFDRINELESLHFRAMQRVAELEAELERMARAFIQDRRDARSEMTVELQPKPSYFTSP